MGDVNEDIIAEPEEPSMFMRLMSLIQFVPAFIVSNGWLLLAAGALAYYVWTKHVPTLVAARNANAAKNLSPQEIKQFQSKEEARRRYVEQLQEKYNQESAVKAEKDRIREEEKRAARLAEVERLAKTRGEGQGQKLGSEAGPPQTGSSSNTSSKKGPKSQTPSLRPEYNPLMGDSSSSRACFRPSGGRSGG